MTKFTTGPWKWDVPESYSSDMARLNGGDGTQICNFGNREQYYPTEGQEPGEADMALIESAPDLYEALAKAVNRQGFTNHELIAAREVLAKATGAP